MANGKEERPQCVRCGKLGMKDDLYCTGCGAPLVNRCMYAGDLLNDPCNYVNEKTAAFCARCGSYTAFWKAGLVYTPYPENKVFHVDELEEMKWFLHPFFAD
ncbi:MAG TPA: hypothetical protein VIL22_02130 [Paenibacillaceae bacterium]